MAEDERTEAERNRGHERVRYCLARHTRIHAQEYSMRGFGAAAHDRIDSMIYRHERGKATWIDLEQPTEEELAKVVGEFSISPRIESELALPSPLPVASSEENAALLVLHFPTHDDEDATHMQEVDVVAGKDFILTVRYEVVAPLHALHKSLEAHELLGLAPLLATDELLELILDKIFDSIRDHTKHVAARLTKLERDMFAGKERQTVRAISDINREFLHLEAALANDEDPLGHFLDALEQRAFFGKEFAERAVRLRAEHSHVVRLIGTHRAIGLELRDTNAILLNSAQNEIMKTLTIMAFVTFPLTLVAGIFSMDTKYTPLVGGPYDFWIVLGIMAAMTVSFFAFFRYRRWL